MNIAGNVDVSKLKLERRFYSFQLNYFRASWLNVLKNWYYWLLLFAYLVWTILFNTVFLAQDVSSERVRLVMTVSFSSLPLVFVLGFFLASRGRYSVAYGEAIVYKTGEKQISIVSKGKYDFERIVTIKVNKITKFHGYYCLAENYFRYVFVPLNFPIDEISKPMIQEQSEQTIEEMK